MNDKNVEKAQYNYKYYLKMNKTGKIKVKNEHK